MTTPYKKCLVILPLFLIGTTIAWSAGKSGGGAMSGMGNMGSGQHMESENRLQASHDKGDKEKGAQTRTRTYEEERKRIENHFRERLDKLEQNHIQARKQFNEHHEEQKRQIEQEREQALKTLELKYQSQ